MARRNKQRKSREQKKQKEAQLKSLLKKTDEQGKFVLVSQLLIVTMAYGQEDT